MNAAPVADNLKSVQQLIAERPDIDNSAVFARLRGLQDDLWAKITRRFGSSNSECRRAAPCVGLSSLPSTAASGQQGFF